MEKEMDQLHSGRGHGRGRGRAQAAQISSTSRRGRAHQSPDFSESFADEFKKGRGAKASNRKRSRQTTPTKTAEALVKLEESQISRFLLPKSPDCKQKRKVPLLPLIQCPVLPNETALKVEPAQAEPPGSCTSTATLFDEADIPVWQDELKVEVDNFSPSSKVGWQDEVKVEVDNFSPSSKVGWQDEVKVEVDNFSPSSKVEDVASSSIHQDPRSKLWERLAFENDETETTIGELESNTETHPGSDIDEDDEDVGITRGRTADIHHNLINGQNPELVLERLEHHEDKAIRELASEEMLRFEWSNDPNVFTGQREEFIGPAGPTFSTDGLSPLEVFMEIWDVFIIDLIVKETNRYAFQNKDKGWKNVTSADIWVFLAVMMLQSIVQIPVEKEYWYSCLPYLQMSKFKDIMTYARFLAIKRCLHFVDNTTLPQIRHKSVTKNQKILPILDHLNNKFSSLYLPEQNIAIDESLLLWKGRLSFAQMIATKAARVGIKSYELCESRTGYLWRMLVNTGKEEERAESQKNEPEGATSKIVYGLIRPLLNKGHTLVMDSFYNSPLLSRMLKHKKTDTMGTLRVNREFVPDSLRGKSKTNTRAGEILVSQTHDLSIVTLHDANLVSFISTYHKSDVVGGIEKYGKYKPQVVLDYNLSMGGIDKKDQMLQAFPVERIRNTIWYKKLFRRLLNISIHNAFVMYNVGKNKNQRFFRVALTEEILKKIRPPNPKLELQQKLSGHYPMKNTSGRARCQWCSKRQVLSRTAYKCDTCGKNLCVIGCFREYHISLNQ